MDYVWTQFLEKPEHRACFEGRGSRPETHALVFGTSVYIPEAKQRFGFDDLDCAALSALRIARWLVDSYESASDAPLASLRLLLSPSELERSSIAEADLEGVANCTGLDFGLALDQWMEDLNAFEDNVAVLYGAGHGLRYRGDGPVLLLNDVWKPRGLRNAFDVPKCNLGLAVLPLRASFIFADCCQQLDEIVEVITSDDPQFGASDPVQEERRKSSGLYRATAGGGYAYGFQGGTTHFVEALIDGLNGRSATADDSGTWQITTDSLKTTLPGLVNERIDEQKVRGESEGAEAALHRLKEPPRANLSVSVDPDEHAAAAIGSIDREGTVIRDFTFSEHPYTELLESGSYRVAVKAHPELPFIKPVQDVPVRPFKGAAVTFKVRS